MEPCVDVRNWVKLQLILSRAAVVMRKLFKNRWKLCNRGRDWVSAKEAGAHFISGVGQKVYASAKKLQQLNLLSGDVNQWDITLLTSVLQNTNFVINGVDGREFQAQIRGENRKICQLTAVRNKIAHHATNVISDGDFERMWKEVAAILISFGECEDELDRLKKEDKIAGLKFNHTDEENKKNKEHAVMLKRAGKLRSY